MASLVIVISSSFIPLWGQIIPGYNEFYIIDNDKGIDLVSLNSCDTQRVSINTDDIECSEMAYLPNGSIIVIDRGTEVFEYSLPPASSYKGLFCPELPALSDGSRPNYTSIAPTHDGDIYFGGKGLCKYNYIKDEMIYFGDISMSYISLYGLGFFKDQLIGISTRNYADYEIIKIDTSDLSDFETVFSFKWDMLGEYQIGFFSLLSNAPSCDSIQLILCLGANKVNAPPKSFFFEVDLENKVLEKICEVDDSRIVGFGSPDAFKATRCILSLDLDEDDSSAGGTDFRDTLVCLEDSLLLHDEDWWMYSDGTIDSLSIEFNGIPADEADDRILVPQSDPKLRYVQVRHGWKIYNDASLPWDSISSRLESIYYKNTAMVPSSGEREILITLWDNLKSVSAASKIFIPNYGMAGLDTSLVVCTDSPPLELWDLLRNPKTSGGYWLGGNSKFISGIDSAGIFGYVIERPNCFSDTAFINISYYPDLKVSLGSDTTICQEDSILLSVPFPQNWVTWSDGSSDSMLYVIPPSEVWVIVHDENGCNYSDSILINSIPFPKYSKQISLCPNDTFVYSGGLYTIGDTILDTIPIMSSCDSVVELIVYPREDSEIKIQGDSISCEGEAILLAASSDSMIDDLSWSTGAVEDTINFYDTGWVYLTGTEFGKCKTTDSLYVRKGETPMPNWLISESSCDSSDTGSIWLEELNVDWVFRINDQKLNPPYENLIQGSYIIDVKNMDGCSSVDTIFLSQNSGLQVNLGGDLTVDQFGQYLSIDANILGNVMSWMWTINGKDTLIDALSFDLLIDESKNIILTAIDSNGCQGIDTLNIFFDNEQSIYYPNVFSPNGDNINDLWRVYSNDPNIKLSSLAIYDRWGEVVFLAENCLANDIKSHWDGRLNGQDCYSGVYTFVLIYHQNDEDSLITGGITLVR